jgi:hypothetical protein
MREVVIGKAARVERLAGIVTAASTGPAEGWGRIGVADVGSDRGEFIVIEICDRSAGRQLWDFASEGVVAKEHHQQLGEVSNEFGGATELVVGQPQNRDVV